MRRPIVERTNPGAAGRPEFQVNDAEAFRRRRELGSRIQRLRFAGCHDAADKLAEQLRREGGGG